MTMIWMDVDTALSEVPVNVMPLIDDTDFKSIEASVAYNATGMALKWNFVTTGGAFSQTAVTPTTGGTYDWTSQGNGLYTIEIPASGGASINNDTEGFGWFTGVATGVLPWRGPVIGFRAAALNNSFVDGTTIDVNVTAMATDSITAAALKTDAVTEIQNGLATPTNITAGTITTVTNVTNDVGITQAGADKVWSSTTRTLSSFGTLVTDIWASATRTLTSFGTLASDVWSSATRSLTDKADFALSSASRGTLVDEVWDEVLTGATHNIATSAGRRLRQLAANIIHEGTLPSQVGIDSNAVLLDSGASSTDGAYDPAVIVIVNGAGLGQSRLIMQYSGSTKTATVDRDWKITLNDTSEYLILADPGRESVNEGLAQGGGASTITLNANASSQDDAYVGQVVFLRSGVGADQACRVTDYDGTTKVATVARAWAVQPTDKTGYVMLPTSVLDTSKLIENIWNNATRTLTSGGSITAEEVWEYGTRELTSGMVASLTVSSTEAASVATGFLDISVYYTFMQTITSTYAGDLSSATKIWFAVKDIDDTDANSLVLAEKTAGLTVVNKSAYATASHGSIVVSGESGAWEVAIEIDEAATSLLVGYENDYYNASVKALIGGDAVHIWDGSCRITKGVIRTIA